MKNELYEKSIAASKRFLNNKYIPTSPQINCFQINEQTAYRSNHDICIIYIKSGLGTILINSIEYPVDAGRYYFLHFFMFYKIIPKEDSHIELIEIMVSSVTYHFILALPGADFKKLETTSTVSTEFLTGEKKEKAEELIMDMIKCKFPEINCITLYELFGILF